VSVVVSGACQASHQLSRLSDSRRRASRVSRYGQFSQSHFLVLKMMYRTIAMDAMITAEAMKPEVWANPG